MNKLTDSQRALILLATETAGRIENFPKNLGGGARAAVMRGLLLNGLIVADGAGHALTEAGYEAVGHQPPDVANTQEAGDSAGTSGDMAGNDDSAADADAAANNDADAAVDPDHGPENEGADCTEADTPNPTAKRAQSKLDQVVGLLLRPQGATIAQVMAATEWQQHSVRGFFAGTLKKKGYELTSDKDGKADRVYRIKVEQTASAAESSADEEE
ncbi:DUF3489 domain-containing protein [Lysobacter gummosus]|uniref:DUF3489 domain-containing protein n=1 Tax=Lysobacter gummosus TaxID=262324 RepID=A0ABY3X9K5_9GAMM|nr:DUF3489 domain-containing protein [Lysobacter gummosus]ALN93824.1 hypothetical protein LG3211_4890 [Lysobacter gummosus]UNP29263.1 DUF3489 domain-containing protein [Lysobacter gummosus]